MGFINHLAAKRYTLIILQEFAGPYNYEKAQPACWLRLYFSIPLAQAGGGIGVCVGIGVGVGVEVGGDASSVAVGVGVGEYGAKGSIVSGTSARFTNSSLK
jgi:hypothetical protein